MATKTTTKAAKPKAAKPKATEYGELDGRWNAYREPGLYYVLELDDKVVIQHPSGRRTEESNEDFLNRGFVPVSPAKSH